MIVLALTCVVSLLLCIAIMPLVSRLANAVGLLDRPDGRRKIHAQPIPLVGGLAIFVAVAISLSASAVISPLAAGWFAQSEVPLPALLASAAVLCAVGVFDDRFVLRGRHKLLGQILAISFILFSDIVVRRIDLFGWPVELGPFALPVTAIWLLGAINSLNLIDGMDGMVGCVGTIIALTIAAMSLMIGNIAAALVAFALAGAVIGFLCFNLPPAKVYLGDCGSMLIGLLIGVVALQSSLKGPTTAMLLIPTALLTLPMLDTAAAITRRTLTGRSIYTTDRGHLHHCLQRSGLSRRRVLVLVSFLCLLTGMGTLASLLLQRQVLAAASALAVIGILVVTRLFGHAELLLLKKRIAAIFMRLRYGHHEGRTHEVCVQLQGSADWQELWQTLTESAGQLQLSSIRLDVNVPALHEGYHASWDRIDSPPEHAEFWRVEIPLSNDGQSVGRLTIVGLHDRTPVFEKIAILGKIALDVEQAVSLLVERHRSEIVPGMETERPAAIPVLTAVRT